MPDGSSLPPDAAFTLPSSEQKGPTQPSEIIMEPGKEFLFNLSHVQDLLEVGMPESYFRTVTVTRTRMKSRKNQEPLQVIEKDNYRVMNLYALPEDTFFQTNETYQRSLMKSLSDQLDSYDISLMVQQPPLLTNPESKKKAEDRLINTYDLFNRQVQSVLIFLQRCKEQELPMESYTVEIRRDDVVKTIPYADIILERINLYTTYDKGTQIVTPLTRDQLDEKFNQG